MRKIMFACVLLVTVALTGCATGGTTGVHREYLDGGPQQAHQQAPRSAISPIVGAVIGGIIGNQFGKGTGKTVMTIAGVMVGADLASQSSAGGQYRQQGNYSAGDVAAIAEGQALLARHEEARRQAALRCQASRGLDCREVGVGGSRYGSTSHYGDVGSIDYGGGGRSGIRWR